MAPVWNT